MGLTNDPLGGNSYTLIEGLAALSAYGILLMTSKMLTSYLEDLLGLERSGSNSTCGFALVAILAYTLPISGLIYLAAQTAYVITNSEIFPSWYPSAQLFSPNYILSFPFMILLFKILFKVTELCVNGRSIGGTPVILLWSIFLSQYFEDLYKKSPMSIYLFFAGLAYLLMVYYLASGRKEIVKYIRSKRIKFLGKKLY